ncbi:MAG: substrate-binding domain-containing protein [Caldilineaceae bacterium]
MDQGTKNSYSRRDFLRMSVAGSALAALTACVPPPPPSASGGATNAQQQAAAPEQAFLNYWTGWSGFEFDELQKQVDKFNEANDKIFVNMTTVFGQYDKVLTAIAAAIRPMWFRRCGCISLSRWGRAKGCSP